MHNQWEYMLFIFYLLYNYNLLHKILNKYIRNDTMTTQILVITPYFDEKTWFDR